MCACGRVFAGGKGYNGAPIRQHTEACLRRSAEATAAAEARAAKALLRAAEFEAAWLAEGPHSVSVDFGSEVTEVFTFTSAMINGKRCQAATRKAARPLILASPATSTRGSTRSRSAAPGPL